MNKKTARQMAREIRGQTVGEHGSGLAEVMHEYCIGMTDKDYYLVADTYYEMEKAGEFDDITGVQ